MNATVHHIGMQRYEQWVPAAAVAAHLSCSVRTIRRYRNAGMPAMKLNGQYRYQLSAVEAWLERHARGEAS